MASPARRRRPPPKRGAVSAAAVCAPFLHRGGRTSAPRVRRPSSPPCASSSAPSSRGAGDRVGCPVQGMRRRRRWRQRDARAGRGERSQELCSQAATAAVGRHRGWRASLAGAAVLARSLLLNIQFKGRLVGCTLVLANGDSPHRGERSQERGEDAGEKQGRAYRPAALKTKWLLVRKARRRLGAPLRRVRRSCSTRGAPLPPPTAQGNVTEAGQVRDTRHAPLMYQGSPASRHGSVRSFARADRISGGRSQRDPLRDRACLGRN